MQQVYCLQLRRSRNLIGSGAALSLAYNAKNQTTSVTPPGGSSVRYSVAEGQYMSGNRVGREIAGMVLGVALIVLLGVLLRDVFQISGFLVRDAQGRVIRIVLNQRAPLAHGLARSLDVLLRPGQVAVNWGQT